ncbi:polysaccharide pyruvyl transferase family protein [Paratractidigestivibacter sp.]|uniref:polysaccharide pyruvyl transferase family protein n=1 Tax=Paratractidigestivibacter sp. TaxID=2847316 RepID=UPI002AC915E0|nr:polysaccharide pyruvyl transferase family protein [Paratractidigestivibacter sp.]
MQDSEFKSEVQTLNNGSDVNPIRIDLITLQGVQNYGSVLQALATQALFEDLGAEVMVVNFVKEANRWENISRTWSHGNPVKTLVMAPTIRRWKTVFQGFNDDNLHLSKKIYTSDKDFDGYVSEADAYCTGSDQVWNSKWNNGVLPPLYLSFAPEGSYKFAFSASFGQPSLSDEEIGETKGLIEQYRHISVREESGLEILQGQYGYGGAIQTTDPTLCVTPEFWRRHSKERLKTNSYILVYCLNKSREFDDYACEVAKRTGLKLVRLCTRYDQITRPGKSVLVPDIGEFVGLIDGARYVLTDSFHATAFSMNMGTEPICIYPREFGGRLASFLRLAKSEQRRVRDYSDFDVVNRPVDFEVVTPILEGERVKARDYLVSVFDEIRSERDARL